MKQIPLISVPRLTLREYVREQLRDFKMRQQARSMRRAAKRGKRKRGPLPETIQETMFECE